jgi:hypothetical protein
MFYAQWLIMPTRNHNEHIYGLWSSHAQFSCACSRPVCEKFETCICHMYKHASYNEYRFNDWIGTVWMLNPKKLVPTFFIMAFFHIDDFAQKTVIFGQNEMLRRNR